MPRTHFPSRPSTVYIFLFQSRTLGLAGAPVATAADTHVTDVGSAKILRFYRAAPPSVPSLVLRLKLFGYSSPG